MKITTIRTSLSLAATALLGACGSESGGGGPIAEANTSAPELIGSWRSDCIAVPGSGTTVTGASGGVIVSGGESYRRSISFEQTGEVEFVTEAFAEANCNTNFARTPSVSYSQYYVGGDTLERNGSDTVELDYNLGGSLVYSMFQMVNTDRLYLGEIDNSSVGHDGSSADKRLDGLGQPLTKQ